MSVRTNVWKPQTSGSTAGPAPYRPGGITLEIPAPLRAGRVFVVVVPQRPRDRGLSFGEESTPGGKIMWSQPRRQAVACGAPDRQPSKLKETASVGGRRA